MPTRSHTASWLRGQRRRSAIAKRFGARVLRRGRCRRSRQAGAIVFADDSARRDLEAHRSPGRLSRDRRRSARVRARRPAARSPSSTSRCCSKPARRLISTASSSPSVRQRRSASACVARGLTEVEVDQRLAAQMSTGEKAARADISISTEGTFEETEAQVEQLLRGSCASRSPARPVLPRHARPGLTF